MYLQFALSWMGKVCTNSTLEPFIPRDSDCNYCVYYYCIITVVALSLSLSCNPELFVAFSWVACLSYSVCGLLHHVYLWFSAFWVLVPFAFVEFLLCWVTELLFAEARHVVGVLVPHTCQVRAPGPGVQTAPALLRVSLWWQPLCRLPLHLWPPCLLRPCFSWCFRFSARIYCTFSTGAWGKSFLTPVFFGGGGGLIPLKSWMITVID